ncbi:alpha/beta hydrolase [Planctomycetota bacterium]
MRHFVLTVLFLGLSSNVWAYRVVEDVATQVGGYDIPITICVPDKTDVKMPVIFYVHGGGWNGGDDKDVPGVHMPSDCGLLCDPLGIIYVGLAYRCKGNKANFHQALDDLEASVAWFMECAVSYNADLSRIGFSGSSAGTTLSAVMAQRYRNCKAYVGSEGMYNVLDQDETLSHFPSTEGRTAYGLVSRTQKLEASPYYQLRDKPASALLFHGKDDWLCHYSQSERYAAKIRQAGGTAKVVLYDGINHTCFSKSYPEVFKNSILETARLYVEAFQLTHVDVVGIKAELDERTRLLYPYEKIPGDALWGRWESNRYGTLIFKKNGQGEFIHPKGKTNKSLTYKDEGSRFLVSVEGEERERTFFLRKNNRAIYELIVANNRWKNRRNDYLKQ